MKFFIGSIPTSYFPFSHTIKNLLRKFSFTVLTLSDLSFRIFPLIEFFFNEILSDLFSFMDHAHRLKLTIFDLQNLVSYGKFEKMFNFGQLNFHSLKNYIDLKSEKTLKKKKSNKSFKNKIFLSQYWVFSSEIFQKNLLFSRKILNINFSLEHKFLINYTISKIKSGTREEQKFCVSLILKNKHVDQILPILMLIIKVFIEKKPQKISKVLKFLHFFFFQNHLVKRAFSKLIFPVLLNYLLGNFAIRNEGERWNTKINSSYFLSFFHKKIIFGEVGTHGKILKLLVRNFLLDKRNSSLILGSFTGLTFMGKQEVELLVIPYFLLFSEKKKIYQQLCLEERKFAQLFKSVLLFYFYKRIMEDVLLTVTPINIIEFSDFLKKHRRKIVEKIFN